MKLTFTGILFFLFPTTLVAQQSLRGTVADNTTFDPLAGVSLVNITTGKIIITDNSGAFAITAKPGDTLRFSMVGYLPQLVVITKELFSLPSLHIQMKQGVITLQQQLVRGRNYYADSLRLRREYGAYFKKQQDWNFNLLLPPLSKQELRDQFHTVQQGVSIHQLYKNLSFRKNRRREALRKQLLAKEMEDYVSRAYDPAMVQEVTGLSGDSLDYFMTHYRPGPAILGGSTAYELRVYIRQLYRQYQDSIALQGASR